MQYFVLLNDYFMKKIKHLFLLGLFTQTLFAHANQTPLEENSGPEINYEERSTPTIVEKKKSFGYANVGIVIPGIGVGYRTFASNYFALDVSFILLGIGPFFDLKLLALAYPTQNFYLGLGVGHCPFNAFLFDPPSATWKKEGILAFGRFAIGYEWYTKSKKRRFIQLTGVLPPILSIGFKF
jgi:hypothetical protein